MANILEVVDKTGRRISLPKTSWRHIARRHPSITAYLEEIETALKEPVAITASPVDPHVRYYYRHVKRQPRPFQFLLVGVKYLNGHGFIITAYFVKRIQ